MSDFSPLFRQAKETKLDPDRKAAIRREFLAHMESSVRKPDADCLQEGMDPSPLFAIAAKTKLPQDRKQAFRDEFRAHMMKPRPEQRASAWSKLYGFFMGGHWKISMASVALVSTMGNVGLAAETSVPGDALYSVKTQVNEPLIGLLALTPDARAGHNLRMVARRLREAEILDAQNRLTESAKAALSKAIEQRQNALDARIAELKAAGQDTRSLETAKELGEILEKHPKALLKLAARRPGLMRMLRQEMINPGTISGAMLTPPADGMQPPQPGPLRRVIRFLRNR